MKDAKPKPEALFKDKEVYILPQENLSHFHFCRDMLQMMEETDLGQAKSIMVVDRFGSPRRDDMYERWVLNVFKKTLTASAGRNVNITTGFLVGSDNLPLTPQAISMEHPVVRKYATFDVLEGKAKAQQTPERKSWVTSEMERRKDRQAVTSRL